MPNLLWKSYLPTIPTKSTSLSWQSPLFWIACGGGCLVSGWIVWRYGVNIFFLDEWDLAYYFLKALEEGEPLWKAAWIQHNEHRHLPSKLAFYVFSLFEEGDLRYLMLGSQLCLWVSLWPLFSEIQGSRNQIIFPCFLIIVAFLTPVHHFNQLMAMQLAWFLVWCGMVYSTYFLTRPQLTGGYFSAGMLFALLSYISALAGIFVLLNGLVILGMRSVTHAKDIKWMVIWLLITLLAIAGYFTGFERSGTSLNHFLENPFEAIVFACATLGNLIGTDHVPTSALIGGCGLFYMGYLLVKKRFKEQLFVYGLMQFSVGATFAISIGRSGFGLESSMAHYGLMTMSFWIGLILLWSVPKRSHLILMSCVGLLMISTVNKKWWNWDRASSTRLRGKHCYHEVLKDPFQVNLEVLPYRDCKLLGPIEHPQHAIQRILELKALGLTFPR